MLESLFVPTLIVALAEIGDKTQLLALLLARASASPGRSSGASSPPPSPTISPPAPWATGSRASSPPPPLSWILAASFVAVALWTLVPDKLDDDEESGLKKYGPFLTTLIAFFLAEMGDKTQVATVMLAAQYPHFILVVAGTTLGMLLANVPVVLAGNFAADKLPLTLIRRLAAAASVPWPLRRVQGADLGAA